MVLKTKKKDNETVLKLHSLSLDLPEKNIKQTFSALIKLIVYQYLEGEKVHIPYLGTLNITCKGSETIEGEYHANLNIDLESYDYLRKLIGQIENNEMSELDNFLIEQVGYEIDRKLEQ